MRWRGGSTTRSTAMDKGDLPPAMTSLLPSGNPLDLFVTITDFYGYQRSSP